MNAEELAGRIGFIVRQGGTFDEAVSLLRDALAQERDACAKIADLYAENPPSGDDNNTQMAFDLGMDHMAGCMDAATFIAEAIRDPTRISRALRQIEHRAARDAVVAAARIWKMHAEHLNRLMRSEPASYAQQLIEALDRLDAAPDSRQVSDAAAERASIVAWLRTRPSETNNYGQFYADAIERGEHAQPEPARREGGDE